MDRPATAVLLDIDGTLIDSTYHHALAWHRAFARLDVPVPPMWRLHRTIGMGGDKLVAEVADDRTEESHGDALRDAWREEYLELRAEVRPLPGASDLVARLHGTGVRVALASSGDPQFSREAIDLLGIGDRIELLVTSEDVEASKPDPDLVAETLHRLRRAGRVDHAVFVGDTVYDVQAAERSGLPCLAVLSGGFGREELSQAGARAVVDGPGDLLDLRHWPIDGPGTA